MSGLRIHHPTLRDSVLVVHHPGDPARAMTAKDLLVHLDTEGDSIVSETVWERLQEAGRAAPHHMIILNEVKDPPTLHIGGDGAPQHRRSYRQLANGDVDPEGMIAVAQRFAPPGIQARIVTHG